MLQSGSSLARKVVYRYQYVFLSQNHEPLLIITITPVEETTLRAIFSALDINIGEDVPVADLIAIAEAQNINIAYCTTTEGEEEYTYRDDEDEYEDEYEEEEGEEEDEDEYLDGDTVPAV